MTEIRLYLLQSGTLRCKLNNIKMNKSDTPYEIPVPFYLLTHPAGNVLIDGGNATETASDPRRYWGDVVDTYWPVMTEADGCLAQVRRLGMDPRDIGTILQSHLHLDHTGAIGRFPDATHVVQRIEYEYAFAPDWFTSGAYVAGDFARPDLKWRFLHSADDDYLDFFGDGVLKIIFTPGHSPGHQSFLLNLPKAGPILLTVDAAYTMDHWNDLALPGLAVSNIDTVHSVRKLRGIAAATGAKVITGHDPDAWPELLKAPNFYD